MEKLGEKFGKQKLKKINTSSDLSSSQISDTSYESMGKKKKLRLSGIQESSGEDQDESYFDIAAVDIFSLANNGKTKTLQTALEMGIDPNSTDRNGNTILIIGAQNGNKSIVKPALRYGGHINKANKIGNTALHY